MTPEPYNFEQDTLTLIASEILQKGWAETKFMKNLTGDIKIIDY